MDRGLLLVEDEPGLRKLLETILKRSGFVVTACAEGMEALAVLAGGPAPPFAVVDLTLPGMRGEQVIAAISQSNPATRIIATSGLCPANPAELGTALFLQKPFLPAQLLEALAAA